MSVKRWSAPVATVALIMSATTSAWAQTGAPSNPKVGVAISASTLGISFDAAARVAPRVNLRAGASLFDYTRDFDDGDITYRGKLTMRSVHAYVDWFPFGGGFHISPGFILHNGNKAELSASLPPGKRVTIGDTEYVSATTNPIQASGAVSVESGRPALLIGWGDIIPRSRRFSVPIEIGVIFQGAPAATLSFSGTACALNGLNCRNIGTDAAIQNDVRKEEANLNEDIRILRFYPVLSLGVAFRF